MPGCSFKTDFIVFIAIVETCFVGSPNLSTRIFPNNLSFSGADINKSPITRIAGSRMNCCFDFAKISTDLTYSK